MGRRCPACGAGGVALHSDGMAQMTPTTHLDQLALHLMAGRYDLLAESYVFPLPVMVDDSRGPGASAAHIWPMYQSLHALLRAGGYDALRPRLVSVELPVNGRFRLWADWYGAGSGGAGAAVPHPVRERGQPR